MKTQSTYLVAIALDVPGAIHDENSDSYIECHGLTILGKFNAESHHDAIELSLSALPQEAVNSCKENLSFHVFELAEPTE